MTRILGVSSVNKSGQRGTTSTFSHGFGATFVCIHADARSSITCPTAKTCVSLSDDVTCWAAVASLCGCPGFLLSLLFKQFHVQRIYMYILDGILKVCAFVSTSSSQVPFRVEFHPGTADLNPRLGSRKCVRRCLVHVD